MSQRKIEQAPTSAAQAPTSAAMVDVEDVNGLKIEDVNGLKIEDVNELEAATTALTTLFLEGGASRNADATLKFSVGDAVRRLYEIQARAEEHSVLPGATRKTHNFVQLCRQRLRKLLEGHDVTRGTLVNYGKVAGVFGSEHPIRKSGLAFAFAKTLSSLETEEDRDYWYEQVFLMELSIRQLQAELSSRRGPESGITNKRKQSKAYICAQTHRDITGADLKTMVTLHLPTNAAFRAKVSGVKVSKKQRPKASDPSAPGLKSGTTTQHTILRFRDIAALASYISAHQQEYPLASAITSADASVVVQRKSNPPGIDSS